MPVIKTFLPWNTFFSSFADLQIENENKFNLMYIFSYNNKM